MADATLILKGKRGGPQPGSGRPKLGKTLQATLIREQFMGWMVPIAREVFDALVDSAIGAKVVSDDGSVYSKAPDIAATRLLFEYTLGKPKEQIEHTGGIGIYHLISSLQEHGNDSKDN